MIYHENVIWVKYMSVPKLPNSPSCIGKYSTPMSRKSFVSRAIIFYPMNVHGTVKKFVFVI